ERGARLDVKVRLLVEHGRRLERLPLAPGGLPARLDRRRLIACGNLLGHPSRIAKAVGAGAPLASAALLSSGALGRRLPQAPEGASPTLLRPRPVRGLLVRGPCENSAMEVEIGRGKKGRQAYGFDDIAIVPSRRTRDPDEIDISWKLGP